MKHAAIFIITLLIFCRLSAQVPVVQEPRHHLVLSNDYVRLLDVWIKPGDTTLYHHHATASVVVFITRTITGSQPLGGSPSSGQAIPGNTFFAAYDEKPITHRVWNQDTSVYHVMDIEVLQKGSTHPPAPLRGQGIKITLEENMVREYRIQLDPGARLQIPAGTTPHLLIAISRTGDKATAVSSSSSQDAMTAGDYRWYPAGKSFLLGNDGTAGSDFVLLEFN